MKNPRKQDAHRKRVARKNAKRRAEMNARQRGKRTQPRQQPLQKQFAISPQIFAKLMPATAMLADSRKAVA